MDTENGQSLPQSDSAATAGGDVGHDIPVGGRDGGAGAGEGLSSQDSSGAAPAPSADAAESGDASAQGDKKTLFDRIKEIATGKAAKDDTDNKTQKPVNDGAGPSPADDSAGTGEGPAATGGEPDADAGKDSAVPKEIAENPHYVAAQEHIADMQPYAEKQRVLENFLSENAIPGPVASEALKIAALMVNDPEGFLDRITGMRKEWAVNLGRELPDDLRDEVDNGLLTEERAKELSKARLDKKMAEDRLNGVQARTTARDAETQKEKDFDLVSRWFDGKAKKDPGLQMKVPDIEGEYLRLASRAPPQNEKQVIALLDAAHKNVTERHGRLAPPKTAHKPAPESPALSPSASNGKKPDSLFSSIKQIRDRHASAG